MSLLSIVMVLSPISVVNEFGDRIRAVTPPSPKVKNGMTFDLVRKTLREALNPQTNARSFRIGAPKFKVGKVFKLAFNLRGFVSEHSGFHTDDAHALHSE